jgi:effector-binding domain-containing protein
LLACKAVVEHSFMTAVSHDITTRHVEATPTAVIRVRVARSEVGAAIGAAISELFAHIGRIGSHPVGPPFARFFSVDPEFDFEVGLPVPELIARRDRIAPSELPGGDVAVAEHRGADTSAAYGALRAWIEANGREEAGVPWEVYYSDLQEVPDPDDWRIEVVWPIR